MSKALPSTSKQLTSSQRNLDPDISKDTFHDLPRVERIYYSIMFPRHFQLNNQDTEYLKMMQAAHSILFSASTDFHARQLIKNMRIGKSFTLSETIELIRDTQGLFGKIEMHDKEFSRIMLRHRFQVNANNSREKGDFKEERLALRNLMELDALAVREKEDAGPVIPQLPNVRFGDFDDAIIVSSPEDDPGEEE